MRADVGWPELLAATFPPGSVTGAPKIAACEIIDELEPASRGPYCGAVGWVDADAAVGELNVAIRTFWIADEHLHFGTGGGITWDSTPEGEWAETELKASRLVAIASSRPELVAGSTLVTRVWIDGEMYAPEDAFVAFDDHGLTVGDGVFETVKLRPDGRPFALTRHLERLARSIDAMRLPPVDLAPIRRAADEVGRRRTAPAGTCGSRSPPGVGRSDRPGATAPARSSSPCGRDRCGRSRATCWWSPTCATSGGRWRA